MKRVFKGLRFGITLSLAASHLRRDFDFDSASSAYGKMARWNVSHFSFLWQDGIVQWHVRNRRVSPGVGEAAAPFIFSPERPRNPEPNTRILWDSMAANKTTCNAEDRLHDARIFLYLL